MTTITPEERQRWYADASPPSLLESPPLYAENIDVQAYRVIKALNALEAAEARISELESWGSRLVCELTDGKMSKLHDVKTIVNEVNDTWNELVRQEVAKAETRADQLERESVTGSAV